MVIYFNSVANRVIKVIKVVVNFLGNDYYIKVDLLFFDKNDINLHDKGLVENILL